jgi:hypothetical protein
VIAVVVLVFALLALLGAPTATISIWWYLAALAAAILFSGAIVSWPPWPPPRNRQ